MNDVYLAAVVTVTNIHHSNIPPSLPN